MNTVQQIMYEVNRVKKQADEVQDIGKNITRLGNSSLAQCSSQICSAWTGANRDSYIKKLGKITDRTIWLGGKISALGNAIDFSANSILAAEQAAMAIILGK